MKPIIIALLALALTSCVSVTEPTLTGILVPTDTFSLVPTSMITFTPAPSITTAPILVTETPTQPTLLPTQLTLQASQPTIVVITPDPDQLERWQEYENALGKRLLGRESSGHEILCEWEILGQSDREVYLWAFCMVTTPLGELNIFPTLSMPALIRLNEDGGIQEIELPGAGTLYGKDIREMFPPYAQERIFRDFYDVRRFKAHILYRIEHLEEPPLIVIMSTPIP